MHQCGAAHDIRHEMTVLRAGQLHIHATPRQSLVTLCSEHTRVHYYAAALNTGGIKPPVRPSVCVL